MALILFLALNISGPAAWGPLTPELLTMLRSSPHLDCEDTISLMMRPQSDSSANHPKCPGLRKALPGLLATFLSMLLTPSPDHAESLLVPLSNQLLTNAGLCMCPSHCLECCLHLLPRLLRPGTPIHHESGQTSSAQKLFLFRVSPSLSPAWAHVCPPSTVAFSRNKRVPSVLHIAGDGAVSDFWLSVIVISLI